MRTERVVCDRCGADDDLHPYRLELTPDEPVAFDYHGGGGLTVDLCGYCANLIRKVVAGFELGAENVLRRSS